MHELLALGQPASFFEHWAFGWTGAFNETGWVYGFWSGFCGGFAILGIFLVVSRKLNCHTKGCWRMAHHSLTVKHSKDDPGTEVQLCRHCHPYVDGKRFSRHEIREMHVRHRHENLGDDVTSDEKVEAKV